MNQNTAFKQQDCEQMVLNQMRTDPHDRRYAVMWLEPSDFTDARLRFEFENIEGAHYTEKRSPFYHESYIVYLVLTLKALSKRREVYLRLHSAMGELKDWRSNPYEIAREVRGLV